MSKFPASNADFSFMTLAEQISKDYIDVIKMVVVPSIKPSFNLKLREIRVLMSLGLSTSAVSASELAEQLRQDPSTVTRSLIILVRGGFIATLENESDGRSKMISLTEKGEEAARECHQAFENFLSNIDAKDGLSETRNSDSIYLERLNDIKKRASFVLQQVKRKG